MFYWNNWVYFFHLGLEKTWDYLACCLRCSLPPQGYYNIQIQSLYWCPYHHAWPLLMWCCQIQRSEHEEHHHQLHHGCFWYRHLIPDNSIYIYLVNGNMNTKHVNLWDSIRSEHMSASYIALSYDFISLFLV